MDLLHIIPPAHARSGGSSGARVRDSVDLRHLVWIPGGAVVGWAVAFVFGDLLTLPVDVYYAIYFTVVIGGFAYYVRRTKLDLRRWIVRRLGQGRAPGHARGPRADAGRPRPAGDSAPHRRRPRLGDPVHSPESDLFLPPHSTVDGSGPE